MTAKLLSNALPWATIGLFVLTGLYALTGAAVVLWGDPGALSFNEYGDKLVWFAGAFGVLGVGRGIAAKKG